MTADLHASAYLVDGTGLAATGVALTHDGAGLYAGFGEEISVETFPGSDVGAIDGGLFRPYVLSTMYLVQGTGYDDVWSKIVALRRRCKVGRTVTLTRQMPDPDGTDANTDHTTTARRQADRVEWLSDIAAVVDIDWMITDQWHGASVNIASGAGVQDILGDIRTKRITLTLAAGPARSIANTETDHLVQFLAVVPSGGVLIDVEACTATAITGSVDMSGDLSWSKAYPMQFDPGPNTLLTDAGTFSVDYQPAYL